MNGENSFLRKRRMVWRAIILLFAFVVARRFVLSFKSLPLLLDQIQQEDTIRQPSIKNFQPKQNARILLYITTHFSQQHVRYFHCCWPRLVSKSPLISSAHIIIAATNTSEVSQHELNYLQDSLFAQNPSYQFKTPPSHLLTRCNGYKKKSRNKNNPLKVPVNYKQCVANLGLAVGIELGWIVKNKYDWMIRLNPDVMIRKSSWLLSTMSSNDNVEGIFVPCNTRQLHTDFFAIRPDKVLRNDSFAVMAKMMNRLNHERTAFREFKHLLGDANKHRFIPDVDPSEGSCRVRGQNSSVYHVHDSCLPSDDKEDMVCKALDGWDLSQ